MTRTHSGKRIFAAILLAAGFIVVLLWWRAPRQDTVTAEPAPPAEPSALESPSAPTLHADGVEPVLELATADSTRVAELQDPNARTICILVLDQDTKQPLSGARVASLDRMFPGELRTDAAGACSVAVPPGDSVRLRVDREGYFHSRWSFPNQDVVSVPLQRAIALSGTIVEQGSRAPIAGARISFEHLRCLKCPQESVVSNARGEYELASVPLGSQAFVVSAADHPTAVCDVDIDTPDERQRHDFELERGVLMRGQVVDFTSGAAISGARIHIEENVALTDAMGAFAGRFLGNGVGGVALQVDAPGRCRLRVMLSAEDVARDEALLLRLPWCASVEGTLTDSSGAALKGVMVAVHVDSAALAAARFKGQPERSALDEIPAGWSFIDVAPAQAKSDAAGHFRIEGLVPFGRHRVISAVKFGFRSAEMALAVLGEQGQSTTVDLRLER